MLAPLLLPLLWAGSLANIPGYQLTVPEPVVVQEGQSTFIACRVSYPGRYWSNFSPAWGYWFKKEANYDRDPPVVTNNPSREVQKETQGQFHLLGDPRTYNCSLRIRDARNKDTGVYFFRVERGSGMQYNYRQNQLCVFVMETPDIHIAGPLESGHPGNITCAVPWPCEQGTPPTFSWIGVNLTSTLGPETPRSSVLTISPGPHHHGTNLTCRVTFPGASVAVESTVQLSVAYAPWNLTIQVFQGNGTGPTALAEGSLFRAQEGQALRLVCVADSNPAAELSWTRGSLTLQSSQQSGHGVLQLPQVELEDDGKYVCSAQHRLGSQMASVSLFVKSPPQLLGPWCSWEAEGLRCSCSSCAQPVPSLRWRLREGMLEGNSSDASLMVTSSWAGPWANSSLHLLRGLSSSLRLSCEAWNSHGTQSITVLLLPEKPGAKMGAVQGAVGGAGVMVLLAVRLWLLFFMVKIYRRKLAEKGASGDGTGPVKSAVSLGHHGPLNMAEAGGAPAHPASAEGQDQELHYASLSLQGLRPLEPQDQDSSTTEYAEIRIQK